MAALVILGVSMAAAAGLLIYWGRGAVMAGDDLFYAQRLSEHSLGDAILHSNLYLLALPMALYKAMFEVFGLGSYLPYRLVAIALGLTCATLFYVIARRRVGDLLALAPTILLLFFGSGWEVLLTGSRIPSLLAIASGLAGVIAVERGDRRGDVLGAGFLAVSITSHPTGIGFVAAAAVMIAFRPSPLRWRSVWVVLIPAAVFGAYLLFFQRAGNAPHATPGDVIGFTRSSWTMIVAAVTGLAGLLDAPVFDQWLAALASGVLLGVVIVGAALRWRRLTPAFWAAAAGLLVALAAPRLSPAGILRTPDQTRYLYPEAVFLLWMLVELAGAWRDAGPARTRALVAGLATAILLAGVWFNVDRLRQAGAAIRLNSSVAQGQFSAYDLERDQLRLGYTPNPFLPTAGDYLAAADAYGRMGLSPSQLAHASEVERSAADRALIGATGIALQDASSRPAASERPPGVVEATGAVARDGPCVTVGAHRVPGAGASSGAPVQAELELPRGGAWIHGSRLDRATLKLGRFADQPTVLLKPANGTSAVLRLPSDAAKTPWRLSIASPAAVTVCGIRSASWSVGSGPG